jgi:uncharacterized protein (TIGR02266 family)
MNTKPASAPAAVAPPANRRTEERISARFAVRFAQKQEAARALRAYSLNLSAGGLCLRTRRAYDIGAQVQLAMEIGGEAFNLVGVIAWVRTEGEAIGVRFINMREEDRVRLQRVLETLKR